MLIGFPNIYGFFIKYFLCLTILTEVICLFTEVICLFIEFNIFVPVMTFLFTDIPIYLRMNVVYIRLKDSWESFELYCYNCIKNKNSNNIQSKSINKPIPSHYRNFRGTNLISRIGNFLINSFMIIMKIMKVFPSPSQFRNIAEPIRYKINYNSTYKALKGKSNFVKFATGAPFTNIINNEGNVHSGEGVDNQSAVGSVVGYSFSSWRGFPHTGSVEDRQKFIIKEDSWLNYHRFSPLGKSWHILDTSLGNDESNRFKNLDPWVLYNKGSNNAGYNKIRNSINLYIDGCINKDYGLKMVYSYIHGYQANELTVAFANLWKFAICLNTYDKLFFKSGQIRIATSEQLYLFLDHSCNKEGFFVQNRNYLQRSSGPELFFPTLSILQQELREFGFILSDGDDGGNLVRENGSNVHMNTYGLVHYIQVCISNGILFRVGNGLVLDGSAIMNAADLNQFSKDQETHISKLEIRVNKWIKTNITDHKHRELFVSESYLCFSNIRHIFRTSVQLINVSVFNSGYENNELSPYFYKNKYIYGESKIINEICKDLVVQNIDGKIKEVVNENLGFTAV